MRIDRLPGIEVRLSDAGLEKAYAEHIRWQSASFAHEILAACAGGLLVGWIAVVAIRSFIGG